MAGTLTTNEVYFHMGTHFDQRKLIKRPKDKKFSKTVLEPLKNQTTGVKFL